MNLREKIKRKNMKESTENLIEMRNNTINTIIPRNLKNKNFGLIIWDCENLIDIEDILKQRGIEF